MTIDRNVAPNRDVFAWSETRWNGCWNPEAGVGLYLHMGRVRADLDLWWAQTVVYLPDGALAVDRSYGRTSDDCVVRTGSLELRLTDGGWESSFDGAAELTSTAALARGAAGSSAPVVPVRWQINAEPSAPVWDLYAGVGDLQEFAGDGHIQQAFRTSGTVTVADREYPLDGVGFKDHSSGVRKWDGYGRHGFTLAHLPGWTLHAIQMVGPGGQAAPPMGAVFEGDSQLALASLEFEPLAQADGGPASQRLVVQHVDGERKELTVELLHSIPMVITEDNDNCNGIDWDLPGDPVVLTEGIARLTAPDGSVGYGFWERGARRSTVTRPVAASKTEVPRPTKL